MAAVCQIQRVSLSQTAIQEVIALWVCDLHQWRIQNFEMGGDRKRHVGWPA